MTPSTRYSIHTCRECAEIIFGTSASQLANAIFVHRIKRHPRTALCYPDVAKIFVRLLRETFHHDKKTF